MKVHKELSAYTDECAERHRRQSFSEDLFDLDQKKFEVDPKTFDYKEDLRNR